MMYNVNTHVMFISIVDPSIIMFFNVGPSLMMISNVDPSLMISNVGPSLMMISNVDPSLMSSNVDPSLMVISNVDPSPMMIPVVKGKDKNAIDAIEKMKNGGDGFAVGDVGERKRARVNFSHIEIYRLSSSA